MRLRVGLLLSLAALVCGGGPSDLAAKEPPPAKPSPQKDEGLPLPGKRPSKRVSFPAHKVWQALKPAKGEHASWGLRADKKARVLGRLVIYRLPLPKASAKKGKQGKAGQKGKQAQAARSLKAWVGSWAKRFAGPKGRRLTAKAAKVVPLKALVRSGLPAHRVELQGTYLAPRFPGEEFRPRPGWAGSFVILRGPRATWVLSLVGPASFVNSQRKPVAAWVAKIKLASLAAQAPGAQPPAKPLKPKQ